MDTITRLDEIKKTFLSTDDGYLGKAFEIVIREYIQPKSKRNNGRITRANTTYGDMRIKTIDKANTKIEIKSSCGELGMITNDVSEEYMEENDLTDNINDFILPKADYIIYAPTIDINYPLEKQAYIFTREQFLDMINSYNGSGNILRIKTSTNGKTVISFQSFFSETRPKASKKIANHLQDYCNGQPTVEEFFSK